MSNIHSSHGTIPCPDKKCGKDACVYHMICHFCGRQLRIEERDEALATEE